MASTVILKHTSKPSDSVEIFPKAFVASLKVLFDILDEDGDGLVHVTEIEKRWASEGGTSGLPFGVLNGLRKASPKDGNISFERFCSGLKMSMNSDRTVGKPREDKQLNTAKVRPNNVVHPMAVRARSAPQLVRGAQNARPRSMSSNTDHTDWEFAVQKARHSEDKLKSGKLPRPTNDLKNHRRSAPSDFNAKPNMPKEAFHPKIQQDSERPLLRAKSEGDYVRYPGPAPVAAPGGGPRRGRVASFPERRSNRPGALYIHPSAPDEKNEVIKNQVVPARRSPSHSPKQRKETRERAQRDNPRRHTVTNGVDYNLLKRMKQLEQERDVLLQGLEVADRARDWYQRQLAYARQRQPGQSGSTQFTHGKDGLSSSEQDRLAYRMARVLAVNKQLAQLMENPEKDFPVHMNLAMSHVKPPSQSNQNQQRHSSTSSNSSTNNQYIAQLRDHNRLLTMEVSQKSELITQLEKDKAALIRQLFEARGKKPTTTNNNYMPNNTTFI